MLHNIVIRVRTSTCYGQCGRKINGFTENVKFHFQRINLEDLFFFRYFFLNIKKHLVWPLLLAYKCWSVFTTEQFKNLKFARWMFWTHFFFNTMCVWVHYNIIQNKEILYWCHNVIWIGDCYIKRYKFLEMSNVNIILKFRRKTLSKSVNINW